MWVVMIHCGMYVIDQTWVGVTSWHPTISRSRSRFTTTGSTYCSLLLKSICFVPLIANTRSPTPMDLHLGGIFVIVEAVVAEFDFKPALLLRFSFHHNVEHCFCILSAGYHGVSECRFKVCSVATVSFAQCREVWWECQWWQQHHVVVATTTKMTRLSGIRQWYVSYPTFRSKEEGRKEGSKKKWRINEEKEILTLELVYS